MYIKSIAHLDRLAKKLHKGPMFKRAAKVLVQTASNFSWAGTTSSECDTPVLGVEQQDLDDATRWLELEAVKTGSEELVLQAITKVYDVFPRGRSPYKFVQDGLAGFPLVASEPGAVDRFLGCHLGLAVGDAVGTTVEFEARGSFSPLTDMVGGGPFGLEPGQWTDDTSMALCLATSLLKRQGFDARDQMERYCRWENDGYLSSTGACFDIGTTTIAALRRYGRTGEPLAGSTDASASGNGSIMRLAPIPLFFYPDQAAVEHYSAESSRTTHAAAECVDACRLLGVMIATALSATTKDAVLSAGTELQLVPRIAGIAAGSYRTKLEHDIRSTGYVVDSLEAALWCFATTKSFKDAILKAANLGDDADTTAAVCGQVAGAHYGECQIPPHWVSRLARREDICAVARGLHAPHPPEL